MTAVALAAATSFDIRDLGARSTITTIRRDKLEIDAIFLNRVVACHSWQDGDTLELIASGGRLVQADIASYSTPPARSRLHLPSPDLRNAAQHLLIVGHGSLLAVQSGELRPTQFRAACRCHADESSDAFFERLVWEIVMPLRARYSDLQVRTETRFDDKRRSTTHVIASLP